MIDELLSAISPRKPGLSLDEAAELLKTDKKALEAFEMAYQDNILSQDPDPETEQLNAKQASEFKKQMDAGKMDGKYAEAIESLINRVVDELVPQTKMYIYDGDISSVSPKGYLPSPEHLLTNADLKGLPLALRPDLTGTLARRDIDAHSYAEILYFYQRSMTEKNPKKRKHCYNMFRAGLDLLDLDDITYAIIDQNKTSMGYWLPKLVAAAKGQSFFRIPKTKIAKVPLTLLQLTRIDYGELSPTTLAIVDRWAYKVFGLDEVKEYFVKTGTYSSKYDFRNAHVHGEREVRELGEYLLFIHNQALSMASHQRHDYVTYSAHEDVMMARYKANAPKVVAHIEHDILPWLDLPGQWSLDIMQNGDDFWMIDMAPAEQSFFYDRVPPELRRPSEEKWLPEKLMLE